MNSNVTFDESDMYGMRVLPSMESTPTAHAGTVHSLEQQLYADIRAALGHSTLEDSVMVDPADPGETTLLDPALAARSAPVLQAYRRCWTELLDRLRSLSPLSGAIKAAYEARLGALEEEAAVAPSLATRLASAHQERAASVERVRSHTNREVSDLKRRLEGAEREASQCREKSKELEQTVKVLEHELGQAKGSLRDSEVSNETLVSAFRRRESQALELQRKDAEMTRQIAELRRSLTAAQLTAHRHQQAMELFQLRLKHTVPYDDVARRDQQIARLETSLEELKREYSALRKEHQQLVGSARALGAEGVAWRQREWINRLCRAVGVPEGDLPASNLKRDGPESATPAAEDTFDFGMLALVLRKIEEMQESAQTQAARTGQTGMSEADAPGTVDAVIPRALLPEGKEEHGTHATLSLVDDVDPAVWPALGRWFAHDSVARRTRLPGWEGHWMSSPDPMFQRGMAPVPFSSAVFQPRFFVGRGLSPAVPPYLRATGLIRQRFLSKQATERLVKACWIAKRDEEIRRQQHLHARGMADTQASIPLRDFLYSFLLQKFNSSGQAVEWGYNFVHALVRYAYDNDIEVFLRVLQGRLPEEVHHRGLLLVQQLGEALENLDRSVSGGRTSGRVHRDDLIAHVRETYVTKTPQQMDVLLASLSVDRNVRLFAIRIAHSSGWGFHSGTNFDWFLLQVQAQHDSVDYKALLSEDENGDQGEFVETLRDQHLEEFQEYCSELSTAIAKAAAESPGEQFVSVKAAANAIRRVDPEKPWSAVVDYIARGLDIPPESVDLQGHMSVPLGPFLERLRARWMERNTHRLDVQAEDGEEMVEQADAVESPTTT